MVVELVAHQRRSSASILFTGVDRTGNTRITPELCISHLGKFGVWALRVLINFDRTYHVSAPINTYYYSQMIGDAKCLPTLLAAPDFKGFAVIGKIQGTTLNLLVMLIQTQTHTWLVARSGSSTRITCA